MITIPLRVLAVAVVALFLTRWACVPRVPSLEIHEEEEPERSAWQDASTTWRNEIEALPTDQIKRLRVEWSQPERYVATWASDRTPVLKITGKLLLLQDDGKTWRPVQKPLLLGVAVCVRPDVRKNWSQGVGQQHPSKTGYMVLFLEEMLLGKPAKGWPNDEAVKPPLPGVFAASICRSIFHTEPGKTRAFQVGLCFGKLVGEQVAWQIIPQSVQMINIPGPKPLSYTHQMINACPTTFGGEYDPILIVHAVNHLRSLVLQL